ncbi:hypothetical protein ANO11243_086750 [Dothideomycetidae sp. 11243]|nr:hypothetical protein ANO11243_086750 [fungal sp. No.11243]
MMRVRGSDVMRCATSQDGRTVDAQGPNCVWPELDATAAFPLPGLPDLPSVQGRAMRQWSTKAGATAAVADTPRSNPADPTPPITIDSQARTRNKGTQSHKLHSGASWKNPGVSGPLGGAWTQTGDVIVDLGCVQRQRHRPPICTQSHRATSWGLHPRAQSLATSRHVQFSAHPRSLVPRFPLRTRRVWREPPHG